MAPVVDHKYDGNGGNEQRIFIKDAKIGWKAIIADATKHVSVGFTQFDYWETLGAKLGGQARRVLDNYVEKWDCTNEGHVNRQSRGRPAVQCGRVTTSAKPSTTHVKFRLEPG